MTQDIAIISVSEYHDINEHDETRTLHAWEIRRGDRVTDSGTGYATAREAIDFAIGVASGVYA